MVRFYLINVSAKSITRDQTMFGLFRKKTEREKFLTQQHRLIDFHLPASEDVKVTPKRDEQVQAALKIFGDLIVEEEFTTKGWEVGWPRTLKISRARSSHQWQSQISIHCEIELSGVNWDRLSPPKFSVEFEADGYLGEYNDEDVEALFEKDGITLASIGKAVDSAIERERKFIAKFPENT